MKYSSILGSKVIHLSKQRPNLAHKLMQNLLNLI